MTAVALAPPSAIQTLTVQPSPRNAWTDPENGLRWYRWQGRDLPSVTSIRRMAGMPHQLHQWTVTQVVNRAVEEYETLTAHLTRERKPRERVLEANRRTEAAKWLRAAATEERDASAALGTAVHDAAARGLSPASLPPTLTVESGGKPVEVPAADIAPKLGRYLDWLTVSRAEVLASEFQVWNLAIGYAGSCDLLVRMPNGEIWLIDLKTGKSTFSEHAIQVLAYSMGEFVGADDVVDLDLTSLLHAVAGMAVLHLADDHWEFQVMRSDPATWRAFRGLLSFATWMSAHQAVESVVVASRRSSAVPVTLCFRCRAPVVPPVVAVWSSPVTGARGKRSSSSMPHHPECVVVKEATP